MFDAATSSAPFVATLEYVSGFVTYFSVTALVLNGTRCVDAFALGRRSVRIGVAFAMVE